MTITDTSTIKKLLLLFLAVAGLYYAKAFLMPLCIGGILATLFFPFCHWMEKKKLPKIIAVCICFLALLTVMAGIGALVGWKVSELVSDFGQIKERATETSRLAQEYIFKHLGISIAKQTKIIKEEQPSFGGMMQTMLGSVSYIFTNLVLVLIYFIFLMYYRSHLKKFFLKLSKPLQENEMEKVIYGVARISQQYLLGLSKIILCLWVLYGIGFSIVGVKNAIFFAILCGLLEVVPYIGNITGSALTLLIAAMHGAPPSVLVGIVVVYGVVQVFQGWVLEPLILGPQVKINPLFTIIALVLGELIWGIPGMVLAIPLTAMFKIVCDNVEPMKPYGFLIGEIETVKKEHFIIRLQQHLSSRYKS